LEVAQRASRESSEDSNGERENNTLTKALQTKVNFQKVDLEGGFFRTQIYVLEAENDLNTTHWCGGAEKIA
jgi:hypothetical protein